MLGGRWTDSRRAFLSSKTVLLDSPGPHSLHPPNSPLPVLSHQPPKSLFSFLEPSGTFSSSSSQPSCVWLKSQVEPYCWAFDLIGLSQPGREFFPGTLCPFLHLGKWQAYDLTTAVPRVFLTRVMELSPLNLINSQFEELCIPLISLFRFFHLSVIFVVPGLPPSLSLISLTFFQQLFFHPWAPLLIFFVFTSLHKFHFILFF